MSETDERPDERRVSVRDVVEKRKEGGGEGGTQLYPAPRSPLPSSVAM